jgi:ABC-2 type transport system permease protein
LQTGSLFVVALLLGSLANFHLDFLLGTISTLTLDIHSIDWAFQATSRFFSGQFVPLWLFPGVLGILAHILPFRSIFSTPLSIYAGVLKEDAMIQALGFQLLWLIILLMLSRWLWGRVQMRIVSQGG